MLSLPLTSHWPKCHTAKSKVNGMERHASLLKGKPWQGQKEWNNFRQIMKSTTVLPMGRF